MKINVLIGTTVILMISSLACANSPTNRDSKAYSSGAYSSVDHSDHKTNSSLREQSIDDGPTDQGRNPDGNGDEIYRPNNDGASGTDETRGKGTMDDGTPE
jgi:hypothetical protein